MQPRQTQRQRLFLPSHWRCEGRKLPFMRCYISKVNEKVSSHIHQFSSSSSFLFLAHLWTWAGCHRVKSMMSGDSLVRSAGLMRPVGTVDRLVTVQPAPPPGCQDRKRSRLMRPDSCMLMPVPWYSSWLYLILLTIAASGYLAQFAGAAVHFVVSIPPAPPAQQSYTDPAPLFPSLSSQHTTSPSLSPSHIHPR